MNWMHIGDDPDVRFGDLRQQRNFAHRVGAAHLEHRHLDVRPDLKNRQRKPDLAVHVPRAAIGGVPGPEHRGDRFLCAGLAETPGDPHDANIELRAPCGRQLLERSDWIGDRDQWNVHAGVLCRPIVAHERGGRPVRRSICYEGVPIMHLSLDRDEEIAGRHLARIALDPAEFGIWVDGSDHLCPRSIE